MYHKNRLVELPGKVTHGQMTRIVHIPVKPHGSALLVLLKVHGDQQRENMAPLIECALPLTYVCFLMPNVIWIVTHTGGF